MKITTRCDTGSCIVLDDAPSCGGGECIELDDAGGELALTTNRDTGRTTVTAAEVRAFAAAVLAGEFDALLGENVAVYG